MILRYLGATSLRQRLQRLPAPVIDAGLAVAVAVVITISIRVSPEPGRRPDALAYALGLTIAALALVRRRSPVAVLLVSAATVQVYYLLDYPAIRPAVPLAVALATAWEVRGSNPLASTPTLQVRASPASSGRRSALAGAALGPRTPLEGCSTSAESGCRSWSTVRATLRLTGSTTWTPGGSSSLLGVQLQSPVGALAERPAQLLAGDEPKLGGGRVAQP